MAGNAIQVGSTDGAIRVKSNGIVVAGASDPCCCQTICQGCQVNNPGSAVIVTTGAACAAFTGTWAFTSKGSGTNCCWWQWVINPGVTILVLAFINADNSWYSILDSATSPRFDFGDFPSGPTKLCGTGAPNVSGYKSLGATGTTITCPSGHPIGSWVMNGNGPPGCGTTNTATVTI